MTETQGVYLCGSIGRDGSNASVSPGKLTIAGKHQKLKEAGRGSPLESSEGVWL